MRFSSSAIYKTAPQRFFFSTESMPFILSSVSVSAISSATALPSTGYFCPLDWFLTLASKIPSLIYAHRCFLSPTLHCVCCVALHFTSAQPFPAHEATCVCCELFVLLQPTATFAAVSLLWQEIFHHKGFTCIPELDAGWRNLVMFFPACDTVARDWMCALLYPFVR